VVGYLSCIGIGVAIGALIGIYISHRDTVETFTEGYCCGWLVGSEVKKGVDIEI
jgi:hypothetical protein